MTDERKAVDMRGAHDDGCYFCGRCECGDAEERRKALAAEVERLRGDKEYLFLCLEGIKHHHTCPNHVMGSKENNLCLRCRAEAAEQDRGELKNRYNDAIDNLKAANARVRELEEERDKWRRIRTPTHGNCCTCQRCGLSHDECRCDLDDVVDELRELREAGNAVVSQLLRGIWKDAHDHYVVRCKAMVDFRTALAKGGEDG